MGVAHANVPLSRNRPARKADGRQPSMFGFGWLALRQAQDALKNGRLEEAQRLLAEPVGRGHRGTGELLTRLARAYAERGERHLRRDDADAAWRDLLAAEQLRTADNGSANL